MIFRDTDLLKSEKMIQKKADPGLTKENLGKALVIRQIKVLVKRVAGCTKPSLQTHFFL